MLIIGHRGAKGLAPENTMASLKAAVKQKVDAVEFDVRTTADDLPVLFHNARAAGVKIKNMTFRQLKEIRPDIITLDEAMRYLHKRTDVVIEVKPGADIEPVIETIKDRVRNGWSMDSISLASFDYRILSRVKELLPEIRLIVNEAWSGVRASYRARQLNTRFITMNQKWLWGGFIKAIKKQNFKLSVYTINNPAKARHWQKYSPYAIITDYPNRIKP